MAKKRNSAQPMLFGFESMADSLSNLSSEPQQEQAISVSSHVAKVADVDVKSDTGSASPALDRKSVV